MEQYAAFLDGKLLANGTLAPAEHRLWYAINAERVTEVREILKNNPGINVNWWNGNYQCFTALHVACSKGFDKIVPLLLAHPGIDVNEEDESGYTPFRTACSEGNTACVRLLLRDPRVKKATGLYSPASDGNLDIIKACIASGKEIDLGQPGNVFSDVIAAAKELETWEGEEQKKRKIEVASLLEGIRDDPTDTRERVRREIGWFDEEAADRLALVIFFCEDLLTTRRRGTGSLTTLSFFRMASKLPLELQTILCHRAVGSMRDSIGGQHAEQAFRSLATKYWLA